MKAYFCSRINEIFASQKEAEDRCYDIYNQKGISPFKMLESIQEIEMDDWVFDKFKKILDE